jgi:predicted nucleic acid-binding protein
MSRIFFDSMLFIYMLDGHPAYSARVSHLLSRTATRGDTLYTSYLTLGEVVAGAANSLNPAKRHAVRSTLDAIGFSYLPFGEHAVSPFGQLRSQTRLKTADAINLACAAAAGMDLFWTGDKQLIGLHVPGIQFIADFNTDVI